MLWWHALSGDATEMYSFMFLQNFRECFLEWEEVLDANKDLVTTVKLKIH